MRQFGSSLVLYCSCLGAIAGCGPSRADVHGTVTFQGKPLTSGGVSLIASDDVQYAGTIGSDGNYSIPGVPSGPVKIAVTSPPIQDAPVAVTPGVIGVADDRGSITPPPVAASKWIPLPAHYGDFNQSGLTDTVRPPKCVINIDLK